MNDDLRFLQPRSPGPFDNFNATAFFDRTAWIWAITGALLACIIILILCYVMKRMRENIQLAAEELSRQERLRELAEEKEE